MGKLAFLLIFMEEGDSIGQGRMGLLNLLCAYLQM